MRNFVFVAQAKILEIEFSRQSEIARFKGLQNFTFSSYCKKKLEWCLLKRFVHFFFKIGLPIFLN